MRILHLEDNSIDADLVRRTLRRHLPEATIDLAVDVAAARRLLERATDFDLVLSDLQLPDGSGLDVLAAVRERDLPLAVVMLTRSGDESAAVGALKAGADDYVVKSAETSSRLARTLVAALTRFREERARRARVLRVLYAEHNVADIDLTRRHFARFAPHLRLEIVGSGREILERLPAAAGEPLPCDVLLLDYRLPSDNALDVLKEVRTGRALDLPVMFVTGQGDDAVAAAALRLGAADYLVKHSGYLHALPAVIENVHHRALLARDQATLRAIFESEPECVKLLGRDGTLLDMNPAGLAMLEVETLAEAKRRPLIDWVLPPYRAAFGRLHQLVFQGEGGGLEFEIVGQRQGHRWLETRAVPMRDAVGNVHALLGITRDVTARKLAEARTHAAITEVLELRSALDEHALVTIADAEGRITFVNEKFCALTGYTARELHGRDHRILKSDQHPPEFFAELWRTILAGLVWHGDICNRAKNGTLHWVATTIVPCLGADARPRRYITIRADITERRQTEQALLASEARFRQIAANIREVFWMRDPRTRRMLYVSPAYQTIWGRSCESLYADSESWAAAIHPEDRERVVRAAASRQVLGDYDETYRILRPDGGLRWIRARAFPVADASGEVTQIVGTAEDITAGREMEQRLRQSQKLEAIGTLAGGIAHDFNNILSGITGYSTLARESAGANEEVREYLDEINRAGRRAADLVQQILAFSRPASQAFAAVQVRHVVAEAAKLLRAAIPASIEFDLAFATDLPAVQGNAGQIHQVVMNLGTNAWHAMRERPGRLTIRLDACTVDAAEARRLPGLQEGPHVRLTVADDGCGMDAATLERVFEPFFTTKGPGEGTGLGLAVVHGIVRAHHGAIHLRSEPGRGTEFRIYFPAVAAAPASKLDESAPAARDGAGEGVLFVDDEESLARLGERTLRLLGYAATAAPSAEEALARFETAPDRFRLVITDHSMPGMTGLELAAQLRRRRPDLSVVLASGFSNDLTPERLAAAGVREVLAKPYTVAMLSAAVRRHLRRET